MLEIDVNCCDSQSIYIIVDTAKHVIVSCINCTYQKHFYGGGVQSSKPERST